MGILDSMFGSGQQEQAGPPQGMGVMDRLRANYAPNVYAAQQKNLEQQAIYAAAMQAVKNPEIANALAMSPQYFQAQQGAHLPQAPGIQMITGPDGSQIPYQTQNPGGAGGHGMSMSPLPLLPPGTVPQPSQAAGATAPPVQGGGGGGAGAPVPSSANLPNSSTATVDRIKQVAGTNKNVSPEQAIAASGSPYAEDAIKVWNGEMSLADIKQTRNEHVQGLIRHMIEAADPHWNELKANKTATWVKSYMDTKNGDIGMARTALGTVLGHANDSADKQLGLNNHDANMASLGSLDNRIRNMFGEQAGKASGYGLNIDTAADELARFMTGKAPTDAARSQYRERFPNENDTPRVAAQKYNAMADLVEKRLQEIERDRDENFSGKRVAKDYGISLPEHQQMLAGLRAKAAELQRRGDYQIQHGQGAVAPPASATELPDGWKYKGVK